MAEHPGRISTTYARQFGRPEDRLREEEEEARRAMLTNYEQIPAGEHPVDEWNATFDAAVAEHATDTGEARPDDEQMVNSAIDAAVQASARNVEHAQMTREERQAEAIAAKLRPILEGATRVPPDDEEEDFDDGEDVSDIIPTDPVVGYDQLGQAVYEDQDTGEQYVLGTNEAA